MVVLPRLRWYRLITSVVVGQSHFVFATDPGGGKGCENHEASDRVQLDQTTGW